MRRPRLKRLLLAAAGTMLLPLLGGCSAPIADRVVTPGGHAILNLFLLELAIAAFILAVVVTILVISIVRSRRLPPDAEVPQTTGNRKVEVLYTAVPLAIEITLLVLSLMVMGVVRSDPPATNTLTVRVVGHQWYWEYIYPNQHVTTDGELHIPVNTPLHFEVQSADVIHSFWVPQFGWKIDAIPTKTNIMDMTVTQTGTFQGFCVEFCGNQHAWMLTTVVAESPSQFQAWVKDNAAAARPPASAQAARGEQVFMSSTCVACHTIAGTQATGTVGPNLTHFGSRKQLGSGVLDNTPANLARWITGPQQVKPGVHMPDYKFSSADLQALVAYLEGLK
ncbi:MAG TPA: cytochrome c oxidase subunit II [Thermomicrobiaceae bacterium]|nr:cytochrome c oxidase subunit II [Thermomicrobiaceae bacterium]